MAARVSPLWRLCTASSSRAIVVDCCPALMPRASPRDHARVREVLRPDVHATVACACRTCSRHGQPLAATRAVPRGSTRSEVNSMRASEPPSSCHCRASRRRTDQRRARAALPAPARALRWIACSRRCRSGTSAPRHRRSRPRLARCRCRGTVLPPSRRCRCAVARDDAVTVKQLVVLWRGELRGRARQQAERRPVQAEAIAAGSHARRRRRLTGVARPRAPRRASARGPHERRAACSL